jgi:hypothetical protein
MCMCMLLLLLLQVINNIGFREFLELYPEVCVWVGGRGGGGRGPRGGIGGMGRARTAGQVLWR